MSIKKYLIPYDNSSRSIIDYFYIKKFKGNIPKISLHKGDIRSTFPSYLKKNPSSIIIITDSTYVKNGITEWIHNWKLKGWRTANKKPVKNKEIWIQLDTLSSDHTITWKWVRGHTGHPENEKADSLANQGIDDLYK